MKKFNENYVKIRNTENFDVSFITSIINSPALNSYDSNEAFSENYISELCSKGYSIVAEEDGKIVGFVVGEKLISTTGLLLLHWIWRSPDAKSMDVYNNLMLQCKKDFSYINSYINEDVTKSFKNQGFNIGNKILIEVCWSK